MATVVFILTTKKCVYISEKYEIYSDTKSQLPRGEVFGTCGIWQHLDKLVHWLFVGPTRKKSGVMREHYRGGKLGSWRKFEIHTIKSILEQISDQAKT